jgi:hypothetical protein
MAARRFGKKPAAPNSINFKFGAFFHARKLPRAPATFGHYGYGAGLDWGMLANDEFGDCVFAGAAHETQVWTHHAGPGLPVRFTDEAVLADYAAVTGFDRTKPETDQGTDMQEAASYRRKIGILDAHGARHKIDSYLALRPSDVGQIELATYLLGAVGVGLRYPENADAQFDGHEPWDLDGHPYVIGGHYVACVGKNSDGHLLCVSWGRLHAMTPSFVERYCDEAVAYVSFDALDHRGFSAEGFDAQALKDHLAALAA